VRSGGAGSRVRPWLASAATQPWVCHQLTAARNTDSSRLTVSASALAARVAKEVASRGGRPGSSSSARATCGGRAPRRRAGGCSPASSQAQVVSEIR
jgi:hypothetical protein